MVGARAVGGRGRAAQGEMPFEEVLLEGRGVEGWIRVGGQFGGFFEDALDGRGFGVESWEGHGVVHGRLVGSEVAGLLDRLLQFRLNLDVWLGKG